MPVTTDSIVASNILRYNPLSGPIILDYITVDSWDQELNTLCFGKGHTIFPSKVTDLSGAAQNYWRLVTRWLNPTRGELYGWIRDLMRHTIALDELFYDGKMDMHILDRVHEVCGRIQSMGPKIIQKGDLSLLEATYAEALKRGKREAMRVILSVIEKDERRVNLQEVNTDALQMLRACVTNMWENTIFKMYRGGREDMLDFGMRTIYREAFGKDGWGHDNAYQWLQYPALIDARGITLQDDRQNIEILDLTEMDQKLYGVVDDPFDDIHYSRIMAIAFYSNVDVSLMDRATTNFVNQRTFEGEFQNWRKIHKRMPQSLFHSVPIEEANYATLMEALDKLGSPPPEAGEVLGVPHMESGVFAAPAVEVDPSKKDTESGTLTLILFAAVIGILFMQS